MMGLVGRDRSRFFLKSCRKCRGDLYLEDNGDKTCFQCGHIVYFEGVSIPSDFVVKSRFSNGGRPHKESSYGEEDPDFG